MFGFQDSKIVKCKCINKNNEIYKGHPANLTFFGNGTLGINSDCNISNNTCS